MKEIFKHLKKYWLFVVLAPLFMSGEVFMDLLQPKMMCHIIDDGVLGINNNNIGDMNIIIQTGLLMIGCVIIGGTFGVMSGVFANMCGQKFGNDIRKKSFENIMSFSFEQTDDFTTGSLITRVTNDITQIQQLVMQMIRGFVRTFLLFLGGIISMVSLNMSFGTVVVCALPLILICVVYFLSKTAPKFSILQGNLDKVNNIMQENVSGLRVVKAYVREEYEKQRFDKANTDLVGTQLDILLLFSYMTPIMNIILNVSIVAIIKVGGITVMEGSATPGVVMAAVTYISQILNAVMRMTMIFQTVSRGMASARRVNEVLESKSDIISGNYKEKTETSGKIEFKNVTFSYDKNDEKAVLKDINLTINPGETFAILGSTGSGKSSLVNLIPRFYDVTKGEVLVDGVDVRDYDLSALRGKIAIALQKSEIFSDTIEANLRWGNQEATLKEVEEAAITAQAMEFIERKPDKMQEVVTQGGHSLSGGQKQRLSIGRAVLKNADILIFDDATSALDLKTEAKLYEALKTKHSKSTKIIIAQRIASVRDANRIAIIEDGKIVACDNHENLLKNSEIYRDIYNSQSNGGDENGK